MRKSTIHHAAAGCLGALIVLSAVHTARADIVTDWNQTALRATQTAGAPVPVQTRVMAIVHAAIFDAVNAVAHNTPSMRSRPGPPQVLPPKLPRPPRRTAYWRSSIRRRSRSPMPRLPPPWRKFQDGPAKANGILSGQEFSRGAFRAGRNDGSADKTLSRFRQGRGGLSGDAADEHEADPAAMALREALHDHQRQTIYVRRSARHE